MKAVMKSLFTVLVGVFALVSCTVKPFVVTTAATAEKPETVVRSLGGSILTKAGTETASMTLPDGTQMSYSVAKKSEVSVPNAYIAGQVTESLADIAAGVSNAATAADVSKASISADTAVKITESNNALEAAKLVPVQ
jgi:hypothetical protein